MANNYTQFCEALPLGNDRREEKVAWIRAALECTYAKLVEHIEDPPDGFHIEALAERLGCDDILARIEEETLDDWPAFEWELTEDETQLILSCDETFNLDHVVLFVQQYLKKFDPKAVFRVTWADTCSQKRVGEFSGGWAVISAVHHIKNCSHVAAEDAAVLLALALRGRVLDRHVIGLPVAGLAARDTEPVPDEGKAARAKESFLEAHGRPGETLGDVESRLRADRFSADRVKEVDRLAVCECDGSRFPGIILGMAHDGNTEYGWVARCDACQLFDSDDHAAFFVARTLGCEVGFAVFDPQYRPRPYLKGLTFEQVQALETGKAGR